MAMSVDHDQGVQTGFIWENHPWGVLPISDNLGESSKKRIDTKPLNQKEGINEGDAPVRKKRSRGGVVIRSENNITTDEGEDRKYRDFDHEMHILTERERRKKMRNMFDSLHALLPELPSKADKSTIVDAAMKHIKNLEEIKEKLEKKKQEMLKSVSPLGSESSVINSQWHPYESREAFLADQGSSSYNNNLSNAIVTSNPSNAFSISPPQQVGFQTWSSQNVVLNICGGEAQFCICSTKKPGLLTTIALVLEKHKIDVISANIMCNANGNFYMIMAHVSFKPSLLFIIFLYQHIFELFSDE
ncbi:putative transcription factor bHLH family [Medicago truncatula]|uniref:Putative transcription factor bHLH family n=1 Tax=Medicago truncatula TaxID=3880 RepID=A0A396IH45_MEDTR|nr:putative transcription factor bHLH family [Medicago truncatula]